MKPTDSLELVVPELLELELDELVVEDVVDEELLVEDAADDALDADAPPVDEELAVTLVAVVDPLELEVELAVLEGEPPAPPSPELEDDEELEELDPLVAPPFG